MPEVIGRDEELAAGTAFLDEAREGLAACLLEGEAGIGKSTVWAQIVDHARRQGSRVLSCRPAEAEQRLSLCGIADLLAPLGEDWITSLPAPQRLAVDVALLRDAPDETSATSRALATGVLSILRGMSNEAPLVVAIDDVQWLDPDSAAVVDFVIRRVDRNDRIGFLFARRIGEESRIDLSHVETLNRTTIGPMTIAAMHLMLDRRGGAPSRSTLARIHSMSGGNPLFALEITRALGGSDTDEAAPTLPVPKDIDELLAARVSALPEYARDALLAAAALSTPSAAIVERASSVRGLAAAEESGLVREHDGQINFVHPLYASAVYAAASSRRRRAMHERLAELILDREERARHLARSDPEPSEEVAALLEDAASAARGRGAWESAAELMQQAADLTPTTANEAGDRRAVGAAERFVRCGDVTRARALLERSLGGELSAQWRAEALRVLAEANFNTGTFIEAKDAYEEALRHATDARQICLIHTGLAYVNDAGWLDFDAAVRHANAALEQARLVDDDGLLSQALTMSALADFHVGRGVDWSKIDQAIELERPGELFPHSWRPRMIKAILLTYSGRLTQARDQMLAVRAEARDRGDEATVARVMWWLAIVESLRGCTPEAAVAANDSAALARLTGSRADLAMAYAATALVSSFKGDAEAARAAAEEALDLAQKVSLVTAFGVVTLALAWLDLASGDHSAAWRACELATVAIEHRPLKDPAPAFFIPDAIEALIGSGQIDRAQALLDMYEAQARQVGADWAIALCHRCRGTLLATRGELAAAVATTGEGVSLTRALDLPPFLGRALLTHGIVLRRARRRSDARRALEEAIGIFAASDMGLWAERAKQELRRLGAPRRARDDLTETERRVAELAGQGNTNREIAESLFISPKTVEANLARVYRKLGIKSRAELGARIAGTLGA